MAPTAASTSPTAPGPGAGTISVGVGLGVGGGGVGVGDGWGVTDGFFRLGSLERGTPGTVSGAYNRAMAALLLVVGLALVLGGQPAAAQSSPLFMVREAFPDTLLRWEGGVLTVVGNIGFSDVRGLAWDQTTGNLYGVARSELRLITIDLVTGDGTQVAAADYLIPGSNTAEISVAFDGTLLGLGTEGHQGAVDSLLEVDKATGIAAVRGVFGEPSVMTGLAIDHRTETIYGTTFDGELYTIESSGTSTRLVGEITGSDGGVARIAFDRADGTLYGITNANQLVSIDLGTLAATPITTFAGAQIYSLDFVSTNVIFADGFESGGTSAWSQTVP